MSTTETIMCEDLERAVEYARCGWWYEAGQAVGAAVVWAVHADFDRTRLLEGAWLVREILDIWHTEVRHPRDRSE